MNAQRLMLLALVLVSACNEPVDEDVGADLRLSSLEDGARLELADADIVVLWEEGMSVSVWRSDDPYAAPGDEGAELLADASDDGVLVDPEGNDGVSHYYILESDGEVVARLGAFAHQVSVGYTKLGQPLTHNATTGQALFAEFDQMWGAPYIWDAQNQRYRRSRPASDFVVELGVCPIARTHAVTGDYVQTVVGEVPERGAMHVPLRPGRNFVTVPLGAGTLHASDILAFLPEGSAVGRFAGAAYGAGGEDFLVTEGACIDVVVEDEGVWPPRAPASCLQILELDPGAADGVYTIDPDGLGGIEPLEVHCDMTTDGGGWTEVSLCNAFALDGRQVGVEEAFSSGIDDACQPYTMDDGGSHTHHYTFSFPAGYSEFYLDGYTAQANSGEGGTSEIRGNRFVQTEWTEGYSLDGAHHGDISFGDANADGPTTSFAAQGMQTMTPAALLAWPAGNTTFSVGASSTAFRIGWGEGGPQWEGWRPWVAGSIYLR